ncbi:MAG: hypothetical protein U9R25_04925 [Chloroflexota bacterium]|nr:hypothetical protein [Chloroflexota bacterium]
MAVFTWGVLLVGWSFLFPVILTGLIDQMGLVLVMVEGWLGGQFVYDFGVGVSI